MSGRGGATCLPLSGGGSGLGGEGQLLAGSQHPGDGGPDVEVQRLEQQVDSHPCVADDRGATVGDLEDRLMVVGFGSYPTQVDAPMAASMLDLWEAIRSAAGRRSTG